ncbi:uracil-DNA glycosylase family protein [Savagea faecisuis]|uniref:Uracil-DNA glycosylase family protein n=1 Tax=Savagea faecisuis TaxID=1274803 RepID=A0ABW3GUN1_9BACL
MDSNLYFESGREGKITLVLSCPGACEELQGRPAVGKSGENLKEILTKVNELSKTKNWTREKVTITNAWDKAEHICKTGRSEAKISEIKSTSNINRLFYDVEHTEEYIICFGKRAQMAIKQVIKSHFQNKKSPKIINTRQPGFQSLNRITKDIEGNTILKGQKDATRRRLQVIAHEIFEQM